MFSLNWIEKLRQNLLVFRWNLTIFLFFRSNFGFLRSKCVSFQVKFWTKFRFKFTIGQRLGFLGQFLGLLSQNLSVFRPKFGLKVKMLFSLNWIEKLRQNLLVFGWNLAKIGFFRSIFGFQRSKFVKIYQFLAQNLV